MTNPNAIPLLDFIPVFQKWIQGQVIPHHMLIDVHNYSHIHHGAGILLVAHEGNFSIDMADGRTGLLYYRKQPAAMLLKRPFMHARFWKMNPLSAVASDFARDEVEVIANDRLLASQQR